VTNPIKYGGYEIYPSVEKHHDGRSKGLWTSSYSVKKDGEDIKLSVIAASGEKTEEAAALKAYRRATLMIDEWLTQAGRLSSHC